MQLKKNASKGFHLYVVHVIKYYFTNKQQLYDYEILKEYKDIFLE